MKDLCLGGISSDGSIGHFEVKVSFYGPSRSQNHSVGRGAPPRSQENETYILQIFYYNYSIDFSTATPFHLGFDDPSSVAAGGGSTSSPRVKPLDKVLLQPHMCPSPVTSRTQRESLETVVFNPFLPAIRTIT